jgi:hypothetical protein
MKLSYFCNFCGKHLRVGKHTACKKALRELHGEEEARLKEGERQRKRYASGETGKALAKLDDPE